MPCDGSYLNPNRKEIEVSNLFYVRDELLTGKPIEPETWDGGYHKEVYCKTIDMDEVNAIMADVCERLQKRDVSKMSLEVQMWWRDHQRADKKRVERELAAAQTKKERKQALAKLTSHERKLLGI